MMGACFYPIVSLIITAIIIMIMVIVMIMVMIIIVVVDIMITISTMITIIFQVVHVLYQENDWVYVISEDSKEGFIPYRFLII